MIFCIFVRYFKDILSIFVLIFFYFWLLIFSSIPTFVDTYFFILIRIQSTKDKGKSVGLQMETSWSSKENKTHKMYRSDQDFSRCLSCLCTLRHKKCPEFQQHIENDKRLQFQIISFRTSGITTHRIWIIFNLSFSFFRNSCKRN